MLYELAIYTYYTLSLFLFLSRETLDVSQWHLYLRSLFFHQSIKCSLSFQHNSSRFLFHSSNPELNEVLKYLRFWAPIIAISHSSQTLSNTNNLVFCLPAAFKFLSLSLFCQMLPDSFIFLPTSANLALVSGTQAVSRESNQYLHSQYCFTPTHSSVFFFFCI